MNSTEEDQKPVYRDTNLQVIFAVTLMVVLGVSSIAPAFLEIAQGLKIDYQDTGLLITVFTIPGVILTPILGVAADRYGRKKVLAPSLFLFGIAGFLCGFARDFDLLLLLRFLQGVGAASLGSLNITIIGDLYSGKERAAAMGYNDSVLSIGTASYPFIGGALAELEWYYPFFLPIVAIPIGLAALFYLKSPEPKNEEHLREYLIAAWQSIKKRKVIGLFTASIFTFIILYGSYLTFFPNLVGNKFGASPLIIGLVMSSMSLSTAITSSQLGRLVQTFNEVTLLKIAYVIYAVTLIAIPLAPSIWIILIPALFLGVAQGTNIPNIYTLLAGLAPVEHRAAFMSINGMVLRIGQTIGPFLMGLIYVASGDVVAPVFYVGAIFAVAMFALVHIMVR
ncbi:MAG: MFS transporter [Candidatus Hadarchaeota archaeon]